ncbi:MAG: transposase [Nitrospirae bacterium]|nr:transposase [Nitrospirota bacterium]
MSRLARVVVPGAPHHVIQRGVRSIQLFHSDKDRLIYLDLLAESASQHNLEIWAWCLMTNHIHLLVVPGRADSLARAIGETHRQYTLRVNLREGVRGHLFQERFHSFPIEKDRHLLAVARYVERNPVRAGMVKRAQDHRWSSARHHATGEPDRLVKSSPFREMESDWAAFLKGEENPAELEGIRTSGRTGRPLGDLVWVRRWEKKLGRVLLPRKRGWPKGRPRGRRAKK